MELENTSAIVTGGASGLGAATATALADKGVRVSPSTSQKASTRRRRPKE